MARPDQASTLLHYLRHWLHGVVVLLLLSPCPAPAVDHADAQAAIRMRDFDTAATIYQTLAESGDAEGQFALGGLYRAGRGVDKDYVQALHWYQAAAKQDHTEALYTLGTMFENGWGTPADLDMARDWYERAASKGHRLAKKKLEVLANVSPVEGLDDKQVSELLNRAAAAGKTETLKRILATGASPDTRDDFSRSALHEASINNRPEAVDLLLSAGANPNTSDSLGDTPLHTAAGLGYARIVDSLLKAGAKLETKDANMNTPLLVATGRNHADVVALLLANGAEVNAKNPKQQTPLDLALLRKYNHVARRLKAAGGPGHIDPQPYIGISRLGADTLISLGKQGCGRGSGQPFRWMESPASCRLARSVSPG
ncbi:MAG: ankyrin repeat domain-containing protein [Candidatus Thiodiazotropha sp.]